PADDVREVLLDRVLDLFIVALLVDQPLTVERPVALGNRSSAHHRLAPDATRQNSYRRESAKAAKAKSTRRHGGPRSATEEIDRGRTGASAACSSGPPSNPLCPSS